MIEYITENFILLYELFGLILMTFVSAHLDKRVKRFTLLTVIILLASSIMVALELWTQSFEHMIALRPILTYTIYILYPIPLLILLQICIKDISKSKLKFFLLLLPELIAIPIYATSYWTKWVCYFVVEDNGWHRGPIGYLPYFLFAFYAIIFIVYNLIYLKRYTVSNRIIVIYIIAFPFVGVILYMLSEYSSDYSAIFTSALLLYFLFIYIHSSRVDPLTGLLNRQSYYKDMHSPLSKINAVVSIDMNDLKYFNDSFGHDAGDKALVSISNVLSKNCGYSSTLYRIGGDEFIIFYHGVSEDKVKSRIKTMKEEMAKTEYVCAFGYAMVQNNETVEEAIIRADKYMYDDKSQIKKQKLEKGEKLFIRSDD